jgi:hypothetical protein
LKGQLKFTHRGQKWTLRRVKKPTIAKAEAKVNPV